MTDCGAYQIDLKDVYCPDGKCSVLQGNVHVRRLEPPDECLRGNLADIIYEQKSLAAGWDPKGTTAKYHLI